MGNMPNLKVTLWGKYHYQVEVKPNPSMHELAWAISLAVHESEGKTKFTDKPRTYNYILECLQRYSCRNFRFNTENPTLDTRKELYLAATELTNKTQPIKIKCHKCNGTGFFTDYSLKLSEKIYGCCHNCNGHGFLIERNMYRVGKTFNKTLVIDIDSHNINNLRDVAQFYENVFRCNFSTPKFKHGAYKTNSGFWLVGDKRYYSLEGFKFTHCRMLYPELKLKDMNAYTKGLMALDKTEKGIFQGATAEDIKNSKFYTAPKNLIFDIAFAFLSIKRERSTIRESKKNKDDKIEEVEI